MEAFNLEAFLPQAERAFMPFYTEVLAPTPNRQEQLREAERAGYFYKGDHWLVPVNANGRQGWLPVDDQAVMTSLFKDGDVTIDNYTLNLMTLDVDLVAGIMARGTPNADITSLDPLRKVPSAVQDAIRRVLSCWQHQFNTIDFKLRIARWFVLYPGPLFANVRPSADPGRYGWSVEPVMSEQTIEIGEKDNCADCSWSGDLQLEGQCPKCGSLLQPEHRDPPRVERQVVRTGERKLPNVGIEFRVRNLLTTWCSPGAASIDDATWLVDCEYRVPNGRIFERYRRARELAGLRANETSSTTAYTTASNLNATLNSLTSTASATPARTSDVVTIWADPAEYYRFENQPVFSVLQEKYPDGVRMVWIKGRLVELSPENFRDVWTFVTHDAQPPDATPSRFAPYMDGQVVINELYTQAVRTASTLSPVTLVPSNIIDTDLLNSNRTLPNRFLPVTPGFERAQTLKLDPGNLDASLLGMISTTIQHTRESVGVTDMIRGTGNPETARAAVIGREQSLQVFQAPYQQLLRLLVVGQELYTRMIARYRFSRIWVASSAGAPPMGIEIYDLGRVLETPWRLQADETIPMTRPDMREHLSEMLNRIGNLPPLAEALGFGYAGNALTITELLGMPGWSSQTADLTRAISRVFDRILEEPWPPVLEGQRELSTQPETQAEWQALVNDVLADEPSLAMVDDNNIPLAAIVQLGGSLLNLSGDYQAVYRINYPGWMRCNRYIQTARQTLAAMAPPPMPPGAPAGAPSPTSGGHTPDGGQMLPPLANLPSQT